MDRYSKVVQSTIDKFIKDSTVQSFINWDGKIKENKYKWEKIDKSVGTISQAIEKTFNDLKDDIEVQIALKGEVDNVDSIAIRILELLKREKRINP